MFFKIHHNLVNICMPPYFQPATFLARQDHQLKYNIPTSPIEAYKFSFYTRSIRIWNQLPTMTVRTITTSAFRDTALQSSECCILHQAQNICSSPIKLLYILHPQFLISLFAVIVVIVICCFCDSLHLAPLHWL